MTFFTRRGDDGTTGLLQKGRIAKYDLRLQTIGSLDEASAALGLARAAARDRRSRRLALAAQRDLYRLMAEVAASPKNAAGFRFEAQRVGWLEQEIADLQPAVPVPGEFIVPGDSAGGAAFALARAIVRRAERHIVELADKRKLSNPALQQYVNRLSSLLFVLELLENKAAGRKTTKARAEAPTRGDGAARRGKK